MIAGLRRTRYVEMMAEYVEGSSAVSSRVESCSRVRCQGASACCQWLGADGQPHRRRGQGEEECKEASDNFKAPRAGFEPSMPFMLRACLIIA